MKHKFVATRSKKLNFIKKGLVVWRFSILLVLLAGLLGACGAPASADPTKVSVSMGYIPDVQFAPFYVAHARNYYKDAGLDVTINHGSIQDALVQVAQGQLTFANASGDEILIARSNGIPIKLVFQTYQQFPVAVFSKAEAGLAQPEDLKGQTVGVPARFGASYVGLKGLLYAANMSEEDVTIAEIGFTQADAVRGDKVPAAVGYYNNEPLVLEQSGVPVNVIKVADYIQLVSNGIVTSEAFTKDNPDVVKRFVQATARGLQDTLDDPEVAFEIALKFIPELPAERRSQELSKLLVALELWQSAATDANGLGYSEPQAWETTHRFLRDSGILQRDVDIQQAFTNELRQ